MNLPITSVHWKMNKSYYSLFCYLLNLNEYKMNRFAKHLKMMFRGIQIKQFEYEQPKLALQNVNYVFLKNFKGKSAIEGKKIYNRWKKRIVCINKLFIICQKVWGLSKNLFSITKGVYFIYSSGFLA